MKRSLSLFALALTLGLTAAAQSQADPIVTLQFTNITTNNLTAPQSLSFSQLAVAGQPSSGYIPDPNGGLTFLPDTATSTMVAGAKTDITAANIFVTSTALPTNPDQILAPPSGSNFSAELKVKSGNDVAVITFNMVLTSNIADGGIAGPYSIGNNQISSVTNLNKASVHDVSYSLNGGAVTDIAGSSVMVTVGGAKVTASYSGFTSTQASQHAFGGLAFHVSSEVAGGGITGGATPEPSGVVLGCLGLSCIGGVFWRARRRKAAAALKAAV